MQRQNITVSSLAAKPPNLNKSRPLEKHAPPPPPVKPKNTPEPQVICMQPGVKLTLPVKSGEVNNSSPLKTAGKKLPLPVPKKTLEASPSADYLHPSA